MTPSLTPSNESQYTVTTTLYEKNKIPVNVNIPVPPDQSWLFVMLTKQANALNSIKNAAWLITILLIISILLALLT